MGRLDDKTAIITGAASGMGAAHARAFVAEGAKVVLTDVTVEDGEALARELGSAAAFVETDVTNAQHWMRAITAAEDRFGAVDVLVNNAGILVLHQLEDASEAEYRRVIDVNQVGVFLGMQAVIPAMRKAGGGSIVNIGSTGGIVGFPGNIAYAAAKWAVRGMTKAAALELAKDGIRVNAVHPGDTMTPMIADLEVGDVVPDPRSIPLGRFGVPHEISAVVVFLASDDAGYVTGADFVIDGGYTCH